MENVYTDKVLGNNEDPPSLMNFIWLFLIIDFLLTVCVILVMKLAEKFEAFGKNGESFIKQYLIDYMLSMVVFVAFGSILTSYMENKKYFLYRDDGLRAIRALQEMMFYFGIIILMIPYELAINLIVLGVAARQREVAP
jgi:Zn-dependent protease